MTDPAPLSERRLPDFEGCWQIDRHVRHRSGNRAMMTGQALFSPAGDALLYREAGQMQVDGAPPLTAVRTCIWQPGLEVWFEDGRYFHTVPVLGGVATHWCDPDMYEVVYDFANWPEWTTVWSVRGPRKDYEMFTRFRPVAPAG